ncbi:enoyl-CoA hydratase/isomerase family protein [Leifsonia kafniensis]|uniref:3-hydroxyisobutyryl-CoA hydrolase n=1 Tax=Leifsonia kafniensis TaxID=475957 RepID=A0ABP7K184_9MICO
MSKVEFSQLGHLALITLNRPDKLNAVDHDMVTAITAALDGWADDDTVATVAIRGAGTRGLCAGGDILALHHHISTGQADAATAFWRDEYHLNATIARFPKPYLSIMDGIVLGGGVGLSAHGSHRVVTERSQVGMPETAIGFVPDVGGTWLLSHAPGELGTYLALTAESVGPGDALALGLAEHFVPSGRIFELLHRAAHSDIEDAIAAVASAPPAAQLLPHRKWIDRAFNAASMRELEDNLGHVGTSAADRALARIARNSPTALELTLAALRRARGLNSLEEALAQELRVSVRCFALPDFAEGIRARVIDRDRTPNWADSCPNPAWTEPYFQPLHPAELHTIKNTRSNQ